MADSGQPEKTSDVFLSYSRRDKAVAERVHQRLTQRGLTCFYDNRSINIGDLWRAKLYRAIKSAKTMVLIISRSSLDSKEVLRETNKALSYNTVLCPIVIGKVDPDADLCMMVNEYHWLESAEPPTDDELNLLVEKVAAIVGVDQRLPVVTILAPPGGTKLQPGGTQRLAWDVAAAEGTSIQQIGMELLQNGAAVYAFPGKESPWAGSVRECAWTVPASLPTGDYTLRIYAVNNLGHVGMQESSLPLTIFAVPGVITVASVPATAEHVQTSFASVPPAQPVATPESVTFKLLEPVPNAKWLRGRIELLRVQVPEMDRECGLKIELVSPLGSATVLRDMPPLELRGILSLSGVTRVAVVSTVVPLSTAPGASKIRITRTEDNRTANSPLEIPVEIIQLSLEPVVRFQQNDSLEQGWAAAVMCALLFAGDLLLKQCWPVVCNIDSKAINVSELSAQLGEAAGSVLWAYGLTVFLVSAAAGILAGVGSFYWESKDLQWLGGTLLGTAWGGGLGMALTLLNASGPNPPASIPLSFLDRAYQQGQVDLRQLAADSMKNDSLFSQEKIGSRESKMILSSPDSKSSPEPSESKPEAAPTSETPLSTKFADEAAGKLFQSLTESRTKSPSERLRELSSKYSLSPGENSIDQKTLDELMKFWSSQSAPKGAEPVAPASTPAPAASSSDSPPAISVTSPNNFVGEKPLSVSGLLNSDISPPDWHKAPLELEWKLLWSGMALGAVLGFLFAFSDESSHM